jgi:molybdenum cofactor cytidylyltransferase/nicotine blue oxidoreductase
LKSPFDVLAVCLCDQPNVGAQELMVLMEQFASRTGVEEMVMPQVNGKRGNPVLFSKRVIETILATPEMVCRPYMDQHPELVKIYETNNLAYILDVDTELDIQKLGITR